MEIKKHSRLVVTAALGIGLTLCVPALRLRRVAAQSIGLSGTYGFSATAPFAGTSNSTAVAVLGVLTFDDSGSLTGNETFVQPDPSPNATAVQSVSFPIARSYTVNGDGTGTMILQLPNNTTIPIAFVATDGGSNVFFVQTGGGNSLLTGTARKQ